MALSEGAPPGTGQEDAALQGALRRAELHRETLQTHIRALRTACQDIEAAREVSSVCVCVCVCVCVVRVCVCVSVSVCLCLWFVCVCLCLCLCVSVHGVEWVGASLCA